MRTPQPLPAKPVESPAYQRSRVDAGLHASPRSSTVLDRARGDVGETEYEIAPAPSRPTSTSSRNRWTQITQVADGAHQLARSPAYQPFGDDVLVHASPRRSTVLDQARGDVGETEVAGACIWPRSHPLPGRSRSSCRGRGSTLQPCHRGEGPPRPSLRAAITQDVLRVRRMKNESLVGGRQFEIVLEVPQPQIRHLARHAPRSR
jgi:hypothetical protein